MTTSGLGSTRFWALVLLAVLAAAGFQPFFLEALKIDRDVATRQWDEVPYKRLPGLRQVCEDVRQSVPPGSTMAFRTPYPGWWEGYSFAYMRASYLLAEYRLVPLLDSSNQAHPEVLANVDWVLAIGDDAGLEGFHKVAGNNGAFLMRKGR